MEDAFTEAFGRGPPDFTELGGGNIGGETLTPGVYKWSTDVLIDDDITIDGGPDDTWIFQISGDLTAASGVTVNLEGGAQAENIVWVVAGGAGVEIGTDATFAGVVLTQTGINVLTNATVDGCLYAQTDVNLQMATVTGCDCDLVDLQVVSACVDEDGEIKVTNSNDISVMVTVTGPDAYEETIEVPANGSATLESLVDGTYSLETDNSAIGLDITTLDISCDSAIPDVVTTPATDVNGSTATLNGELTDLGDFDTVDVFFEWRELGEGEWIATDTQTLDAPGDFNAEIAGLEPGSTYEFRAIGVANDERFEGATLRVITTVPGAPEVITSPATEINGSIATLNGELLDLGDFDTVDVFFEWRELGEEEWIATDTQTLDAPGDFNAGITGLEPGSTYEFRAVVVANGTRDEGAILKFTKKPRPDLVYWQVDFGAGKNVPIPPSYWPDDGFAALGTNEGVEQNPSFGRTKTPGQLGDVTIQDYAFQFDDNDEPTEVSITFTVDEGGESRFLHLAVFSIPGPYDQDEIGQQELFDETSGEYSGGDTGTLTLSLPTA